MSTSLKTSPSTTQFIALDDGSILPVRWVLHPRARRLKLTVDPDGARLTLPPRVSAALAEQFIQANRPWLQAQALRYADAPKSVALIIGQTAQLPLHDQWLPVQWRQGRFVRIATISDVADWSLINSSNTQIVIEYPPSVRPAQLAGALKEFYLSMARADVGRWLPNYLADLPRIPSSIKIRPLASLWGSLSARSDLSLDLALVLGKPSAFEYVLVHELCHLIEANHSRRFWRQVEDRCSNWQDQRDYLHAIGWQLKHQLQIFLTPSAS